MTRADERVVRLEPRGFVELPGHQRKGGFDHADVDGARGLLYVAHSANDAVDVIDLDAGRHVRSIGGLSGVAGALVDRASGRVFTSNRGEDTVALFGPGAESLDAKVAAGFRPNGLAHDPGRDVLLCANVGDPEVPGTASVTLVHVPTRAAVATVTMPGRTRWAVFDPRRDAFFVNIADPAVIAVVDPASGTLLGRIPIPATGPHGLDLDSERRRLYCACDAGVLVTVDAGSGEAIGSVALSGAPDVVFLDRTRTRLFVAIGDPGVIDVVDVIEGRRIETVSTEPGAHTLAVDAAHDRVYAFLPRTHRAAVFADAEADRGR